MSDDMIRGGILGFLIASFVGVFAYYFLNPSAPVLQAVWQEIMAPPPDSQAGAQAKPDESAASDGKLHCSFCGKSQVEVAKLIAGPNVYICDECIGLCNEILVDEDKDWGQQQCKAMGVLAVTDPKTLNLDRYQWRNRLLLLNNDGVSVAAQQEELFKAGLAGANERALVLIQIDASFEAEWQKYGFESGQFKMLLIGKDGGVKAEYKEITQLEPIFNLIDSMPMRQSEMREQAKDADKD